MMYFSDVHYTFLWFLLQNIGGEAFIAQPSWLSIGILTQTSPAQHPAIAATSSCNPTNGLLIVVLLPFSVLLSIMNNLKYC